MMEFNRRKICTNNIEKVPGDGNCLYHCILRSGYGGSIEDLRWSVSDRLQSNRNIYECFDYEEDWLNLISGIRSNRWGGELEIRVIQDLYITEFRINVYRYVGDINDGIIELNWRINESNILLPQINILFDNSHYDLLRFENPVIGSYGSAFSPLKRRDYSLGNNESVYSKGTTAFLLKEKMNKDDLRDLRLEQAKKYENFMQTKLNQNQLDFNSNPYVVRDIGLQQKEMLNIWNNQLQQPEPTCQDVGLIRHGNGVIQGKRTGNEGSLLSSYGIPFAKYREVDCRPVIK